MVPRFVGFGLCTSRTVTLQPTPPTSPATAIRRHAQQSLHVGDKRVLPRDQDRNLHCRWSFPLSAWLSVAGTRRLRRTAGSTQLPAAMDPVQSTPPTPQRQAPLGECPRAKWQVPCCMLPHELNTAFAANLVAFEAAVHSVHGATSADGTIIVAAGHRPHMRFLLPGQLDGALSGW
jgi:hypothetical protein